MIKHASNLAIIPARSGSKGLRDKNVRDLCGKPLMAYTIEAALKSGIFSEVMVSTDSERYADIARKFNASVPFLRSAEQSGDAANSWEAVLEVLDNYEHMGMVYETACLLQPTSPLRMPEDVIGSYELFAEAGGLPVVSVCEVEHSPLWCMRVTDDRRVVSFVEGGVRGRRQDGERFYRLNGAIYIVDVKWLKKNGFTYDKGCYAFAMSQERSVDIDTEFDFTFAETLLKRRVYE